jgi:polar amino acid transport system substrate-binding protein
MTRGKLDAVANALEWESDTTGWVWTEGIIRVSDNVVMTADRRAVIANLDELSGKLVVLMHGYTYPSLEEMIESGAIKSSRANRFESLLKMVEYKRVDYGIIDMNVAKWVMREKNLVFDPPLFFATPGFDEVEFRIILGSEKWAPFVRKFNEALAQFKLSGELEKILDKYR